MSGPAVTIVASGGTPVIAVSARAPVVTVYVPPAGEAPRGTPITIVTDNGTPMVVEGYTP